MPTEPSNAEEKYFARQQAETRKQLRREMERRAREAHAKQQLAADLGTDDAAVVEHLHALGLDAEVAKVLHLLPLVEVAWADGSVSSAERSAIMTAAEAHGVGPDSDAGRRLAALLEERPSDTLLAEIRSVLRHVLRAKGMQPHSLLEACQSVADASGGLFGLGNRIADAELETIRRVTEALSGETADRITRALE